MIDIYGVKTRIRDIFMADLPYIIHIPYVPQQIDHILPLCLLYTGSFSLDSISGTQILATIPIDMLLYCAPYGTDSTIKKEFEVDAILQDVMGSFTSRPKLQLNDGGYEHTRGSISLSLLRDTYKPLSFPFGFSQAMLYYGLHIRITIPLKFNVGIKVEG